MQSNEDSRLKWFRSCSNLCERIKFVHTHKHTKFELIHKFRCKKNIKNFESKMNLTGLSRLKKSLLIFVQSKRRDRDKKLKTKASEEFWKNIQKSREIKEEAKIVYVNIHLKAVNENALIWSFAMLLFLCFLIRLNRFMVGDLLRILYILIKWMQTKKIKTNRNDSEKKAATLIRKFLHLLLKALKKCAERTERMWPKTAFTPIDFFIHELLTFWLQNNVFFIRLFWYCQLFLDACICVGPFEFLSHYEFYERFTLSAT